MTCIFTVEVKSKRLNWIKMCTFFLFFQNIINHIFLILFSTALQMLQKILTCFPENTISEIFPDLQIQTLGPICSILCINGFIHSWLRCSDFWNYLHSTWFCSKSVCFLRRKLCKAFPFKSLQRTFKIKCSWVLKDHAREAKPFKPRP